MKNEVERLLNGRGLQMGIKNNNLGLEDSLKDFENYKWIANNYSEYEAL